MKSADFHETHSGSAELREEFHSNRTINADRNSATWLSLYLFGRKAYVVSELLWTLQCRIVSQLRDKMSLCLQVKCGCHKLTLAGQLLWRSLYWIALKSNKTVESLLLGHRQKDGWTNGHGLHITRYFLIRKECLNWCMFTGVLFWPDSILSTCRLILQHTLHSYNTETAWRKVASFLFTSRPSSFPIADVGQTQRPAGNGEPVRTIQDAATQKEDLHPHL